MFLHLGGDIIIPESEIICIINLDTVDNTPATREFLRARRDEDKTFQVVDGSPAKSAVITDSGIYFSSIASITLYKRAYQRGLPKASDG